MLATMFVSSARSADAESSQVAFARDILPILSQKCVLCHGPDEQESGLRLDTEIGSRSECDSGAHAIVPGDTDSSELLRRVSSSDPDERMPPDGDPLTPGEIKLLRNWISNGGRYETHWAYRPIEDSVPPARKEQPRHPVDRFVQHRLESEGITPSPRADRFTLIKRLHYDLTGLPPAVHEVDAFVASRALDSYEKLVDRLLNSEHFAERWARHWLDKARYADSDGYEKDNGRPDAWRYRDWVIEAIDQDLPYDQFVIQQLAGDLLPNAGPMERLATAFNRQTLTNTEGGTDQEEFRVAAVMDRVETLGTVWLGLTVGCARCHNHKYDQFTQADYYRLFAFFNNADEANTEVPISAIKLVEFQQKHAEFESQLANAMQQVASAREAGVSAERMATLESRIEELKKNAPKPPLINVRVLSDRRKNFRETHVLERGDFLRPGELVVAATPEVLRATLPHSDSTGRSRLELARWIVSPDNPLTPRVVVNHVWKHLFGYGLVRTMNDFGVRGELPSHPGLLDHLASRFAQDGWSRKSLIKYILMSETYQQSSRFRPELAEIDPTNRLLYRQNRFRVEAEILRDACLAVSGLLSKQVGGPSAFPPIPPSITDLTYNSSFKWKTSTGKDRYRRGMYTYFKRTAPHPNLITFDCPDSNVTNVSRNRSNTPIGALTMLNNQVFAEAAQAFGSRLSAMEAADDERLSMAFREAVARPPSDTELQELVRLLDKNRSWYAEHHDQADEFVGNYTAEGIPIDETASWIGCARVLLNLDEFITRE